MRIIRAEWFMSKNTGCWCFWVWTAKATAVQVDTWTLYEPS